MRRFAFLLVVLVSVSAHAEVPPVPALPPLPASVGAPLVVSPAPLPHVKNGAFDLRFVTVGQVVDLVYGDALRVPHVISDDVLEDKRLVSFQFDAAQSKADLRGFMSDFLASFGYEIRTRNGVDFVGKRVDAPAVQEGRETFVYRVKNRSAAYLVQVLGPLFGSHMSTGARVVPAPVEGRASEGSAASVAASGASAVPVSVALSSAGPSQLTASDNDVVFVGSADEVQQIKALLPALDVAPGEVVVRGWVYEVTENNSDESAFSLAVHVLGGSLSLSNSDTTTDRNAVRFAGPRIDAAISALNATTNFRQISSPHVRVQSGQRVRLDVGEQVPTLGSISYQGASGTPVQSVTYQDAGLIFDVEPMIVGDAIDVAVDEQISDFVATTTGVAGSPTKNTREMQTRMRMGDGEVVVIGGLTQNTSSDSRNHFPWLPSFLDGTGKNKGRTEILLVLQVQKA